MPRSKRPRTWQEELDAEARDLLDLKPEGKKRKPNPGFKNKRDGFLNLDKPPKEQKKICRRNLEQSPLLQLSAEIREDIYRYVLGQRHIQWEYKPHEHRNRQHKGVRYHEHTPGGLWKFCAPSERKLTCKFPGGAEWAYFRWKQTTHATKVPQLRRVCRQLYQETVLWHYQHNLISFDNYWVLKKWAGSVKPAELRAISRLCLPYHSLKKKEEKKFTGLTEVYVNTGPD